MAQFRRGSMMVPRASGAETLSALDWAGDGQSRRMIAWVAPQANGMPIYGPLNGAGPATLGATYFYRCKPFRKDTSATSVSRVTSNQRYWSAYFWGNSFNDGGEWQSHPATPVNGNNIFQWAPGDIADTYWGFHPYPDGVGGAPVGIPQYPEISVRSNDFTTHNLGSAGLISPAAADALMPWGSWTWCMVRVQKTAANDYNHETYWQLDVDNSGLEYGFTDSTWTAAGNPPQPVITVGQSAWVTYAGNEEFCGAIRGLIIVPQWITSLANCRLIIANTTSAGVLATLSGLGITPWYVNMNPTVADISDKSGQGHHPIWVGNGRPADVVGG